MFPSISGKSKACRPLLWMFFRKSGLQALDFPQAAFMDVFPINNNDESLTLEFVSYDLGEPRYTVDEALAKDAIYSAPLKATFRILQREEGGKVKQIAEQDVYICDIPLMTENATFVINGAERVVG